MNILIILASPHRDSFNHAIADTVRHHLAGLSHQVTLHDLYAEGFDPVLTAAELDRNAVVPEEIRAHIGALLAADGLIVVHPNWWGQPPAMLKGWLDRVLRAGDVYRFGSNAQGQGIVIGQLKAQTALVLTTSNTPREAELTLYGDPLDNLWKRCVWSFCGVSKVERRNFESIIMSTPEQRRQWLAEALALADACFAKTSAQDAPS